MTLVTLSEPHSPAAEAYQSLRTNIEFSGLEQSIHSLLVTSPGPETDKSTTLANLAVVMAQAGDRVVIVDGDLRRPRQHEIFGLNNQRGLTHWLQHGGVLPLQDTEVNGLRVLTAGPIPPNPVALLSTNRLSDLITGILQDADYVLCDAPPVLAVTDAALWASKVDGVLLAVSAGQTKREYAQRAKALLERVRGHIVGAVLVNVNEDATLAGQY